MPKLDVTNDIDYMSILPAERVTPLLEACSSTASWSTAAASRS
ncbi:Uncharacterised protein [Raoultella terrigena]|uniref:Uncharacterized protein n=1 Tax=Raoultella terrigena TaxID=577 RepID=A0A4U9D2Q0_RAOTE|nr:Uncharacterised protein [Raoultella terrigena]